MADMAQPRKAGMNFLPFALAVGGGLALGLIVFGWVQFGESIYLTRLSALVAGCF
jgi:hypothetical protein